MKRLISGLLPAVLLLSVARMPAQVAIRRGGRAQDQTRKLRAELGRLQGQVKKLEAVLRQRQAELTKLRGAMRQQAQAKYAQAKRAPQAKLRAMRVHRAQTPSPRIHAGARPKVAVRRRSQDFRVVVPEQGLEARMFRQGHAPQRVHIEARRAAPKAGSGCRCCCCAGCKRPGTAPARGVAAQKIYMLRRMQAAKKRSGRVEYRRATQAKAARAARAGALRARRLHAVRAKQAAKRRKAAASRAAKRKHRKRRINI